MNTQAIDSKDTKNKVAYPFTVLGMIGVAAIVGHTPSFSSENLTNSSQIASFPTIVRKNSDEYCDGEPSSTQNTFVEYFTAINYFSTQNAASSVNNEFDRNSERLHNYLTGFIKEVEKNQHYLSLDLSNAIAIFFKSAYKISKIAVTASAVHLLPDNGFKFILKLLGGRVLMLSQSMESEERDLMVYSLFDNGKLLTADALPIDDFLKEYRINPIFWKQF